MDGERESKEFRLWTGFAAAAGDGDDDDNDDDGCNRIVIVSVYGSFIVLLSKISLRVNISLSLLMTE